MRKLLLATVAALGASMGVATIADAQTAPPAPGTITVRLNGRLRFYGALVNDRDTTNNLAGSTSGTTPVAGGGNNKNTNYAFGTYARLYPGFDGVAANGLRYGASLEIRQDQFSGAGGGNFGSISGSNRSRNGLYFRRAWGYLGTQQLGTIRVGMVDGPSSLYMTGNFENFNDGGWNGDAPGFLTAPTSLTWPFADVGEMYGTTKAVYLSPQLFGFDFGVAYEPNSGGGNLASNCGGANPIGTNFVNSAGSFTTAAGANSSGAAGPGCDRLSSSPVNGESRRRRNTVDALLRYRGTFAGFGVAATGGYIGSSNVKDNSGFPFSNSVVGTRLEYEGLSVGDFGVAVTYGGFSVGGKYQFGRFNGQWQLAPEGAPGGEAWLVGTSYTAGPVIVGAHYVDYKSAGDNLNSFAGRERREQGIAAGATYSLAPGVSVFASYLWAQRKQNGFDFVTGQGVTAANAATGGTQTRNKMIGQVIGTGISFQW